jgi:hypothetical protein
MRLGPGHHEHVWAARYSTDEAACRNGLRHKNIRLAHDLEQKMLTPDEVEQVLAQQRKEIRPSIGTLSA